MDQYAIDFVGDLKEDQPLAAMFVTRFRRTVARKLPDGRWIDVNPLLYERAQIGISNTYDRCSYSNAW
jgi:hypothetical protein